VIDELPGFWGERVRSPKSSVLLELTLAEHGRLSDLASAAGKSPAVWVYDLVKAAIAHSPSPRPTSPDTESPNIFGPLRPREWRLMTPGEREAWMNRYEPIATPRGNDTPHDEEAGGPG
jgi:hypothetical protein